MTKTTVAIKMETKERLAKFGNLSDSFDSTLNRMMDHIEKCRPEEPEGPKSDFIDEELAGDSEQADEE